MADPPDASCCEFGRGKTPPGAGTLRLEGAAGPGGGASPPAEAFFTLGGGRGMLPADDGATNKEAGAGAENSGTGNTDVSMI